MNKIKVYIEPEEKSGWSTTSDYLHIKSLVEKIGAQPTKNVLTADVIHNIWWNVLKFPAIRSIFRKPTIATCTNFIDLDNDQYELRAHFEKVNKAVDVWIVPSVKQQDVLERNNCKTSLLPFIIDTTHFFKKESSKAELCAELNLDYSVFKDKLVIGSFMRDSLGSDLSKPKWQKDPQLMIDICKQLPKDKFILFLAGPRRHFIIAQCKKFNIPYYYHGQETEADDFGVNKIPYDTMPWLYRFTDMQIVTSKSEGGPKAIPESILTGTTVLSKNIGHASDYLPEEFVFEKDEDLIEYVKNIVTGKISQKSIDDLNAEAYAKAQYLQSEEFLMTRLEETYKMLIK